ncbi:restriction endonuclease subunit S [Histophilus somni]|uniref:restriction endonuclease subunit S n=1 Tax=Histophilus somni TaxID=731 RepID=UPI0031EB056D
MNASLNEKLQNVQWGEYRIGDLFDVDKLWVYGKNKNWKNRFENKKNNSLPVISGITVNNGINYYTDDLYDEEDKFLDSLTISTRGEYSGTVTYHKGEFLLANNILVMKMPNLTYSQKIFMGSLINKLPYGGYNGYPRKETLKNNIIKLPTKDNKIDFEFMESFISELEEERISELSAYLTVSGLDNYELSSEEKEALESYNDIMFDEYKFKDIFNNIKQGRRLKKDDQIIGTIPFVMSGITNTGVVGYISNPVALFSKNSITIDIFGNSFYRNYDFGAGDDTGVYWNDEVQYSKETMLYFTAAMEKSLSGKYSYGKKLRSSQSYNFKIQLPTKNNEIDFSYMELLISAVQKLVIKDVVMWKDKKIEATKQLVGRN